jgi:hypothetical protein
MFLALLFATGVLLGSLLTYGMATALIVHLVVRLIRTGYTGHAGNDRSWVKVSGRVGVFVRKRRLCRIATISM